MLMKQNVNNDVTKDSPYKIGMRVLLWVRYMPPFSVPTGINRIYGHIYTLRLFSLERGKICTKVIFQFISKYV